MTKGVPSPLRATTSGAVTRRAGLAVISATSTVQGTFGSRQYRKRTCAPGAFTSGSPAKRSSTGHSPPGLYGTGAEGENAAVTERVCENCGIPDDELLTVRRFYVVPPSWDTPGSQTVIAEPELWCVSCVSQYPCEIVDA
jgi:hypothetical protein